MQELQEAVERDRRLKPDRRGKDPERCRDHERVQHDTLDHLHHDRADAALLRSGDRYQRRHQGEQQQRIEAENQRDGHGRFRPKRGQRETWAHVADIAVAAGEPGDRGFRHIALAQRQPDGEGNEKGAERRQCGGGDEIGACQLLQRRLRQDAVKQRRQRHVEDEEIHPGERTVRNLL